MRYSRFLILIFTVSAFLVIRKFIDRKSEEVHDIEVIRTDLDDGDLHLGSWAQKNDNALIHFRLRRDGHFTYDVVNEPGKDSLHREGKHRIIPATHLKPGSYPRLVAVSVEGDTIINHQIFIRRSPRTNVDMLVMKDGTGTDAREILFYRIKQ